ncbi:unnamed protein product [Rhodiola kirilowii]
MDVHVDNQIDNNDVEDEEFKCCVCLELMYKPVVLACGHICCFWCVFQTMNPLLESNCPICRHPYNHFPNVCALLHFVIQALHPIAYKQRELQVAEEEKEHGYSSPQFPKDLSAFPQIPQLTNHGNSSSFDIGPSAKKEDPSCLADSSKSIISNIRSYSGVVLEGRRESEAFTSGIEVVKETNEANDSYQHKSRKNLLSLDFSCPVCKNLLLRPVVLNCGHVHCEHCLSNQQNDDLKCQVCKNPNPNGLPKVCLVLDNLIAKQFQELYGQRRNALLKQAGLENGGPSNSATQSSRRTIKKEDYALWWTGRGPKVHIGVGCDYCGMSPILGERYKCLDCTEKIGFDLCETCYTRSSVLPGRFNQQHKLGHRFEIKQPDIFNHVYIRQEVGESDEDDGPSHDAPDDTVDGLSRTSLPDAQPSL